VRPRAMMRPCKCNEAFNFRAQLRKVFQGNPGIQPALAVAQSQKSGHGKVAAWQPGERCQESFELIITLMMCIVDSKKIFHGFLQGCTANYRHL